MRLLVCLGTMILALILACPAGAQTVLMVDINTPASQGTQDGDGWDMAYDDLQEAIADAMGNPAITDIIVAHGVYVPPSWSMWQLAEDQNDCGNFTPNDRTRSFIVPLRVGFPALRIHGGFRGNAAANPSEDPLLPDGQFRKTILSGDIDGVAGSDGNSYHVLIIDKEHNTGEVEIDGFKIVGGNANEFVSVSNAQLSPRGGGVLVVLADALLTNLRVRDNGALLGGGIAVTSVFNSNACDRFPNPTMVVRIARSKIRDNQAGGNGGGLHISATTTVQIGNTKFLDNFAGDMGGGIFVASEGANVMGYNLLLAGNSLGLAPQTTNNGRGSAIMVRRVSSSIWTNCTIANNTATGVIGDPFPLGAVAIEEEDNVPNTLDNCILFFNSGNDLAVTNNAMNPFIFVGFSDIGSISGTYFDNGGNISLDPLFINAAGGNYHLTLTISPPVTSPCIDAGSGGLLPNDVADVDEDGSTGETLDADLDLNPREWGPSVEMGVYEVMFGAR